MEHLYVIEFETLENEWRTARELDGTVCIYFDHEHAQRVADELRPQVEAGTLRIATYKRDHSVEVEWDD